MFVTLQCVTRQCVPFSGLRHTPEFVCVLHSMPPPHLFLETPTQPALTLTHNRAARTPASHLRCAHNPPDFIGGQEQAECLSRKYCARLPVGVQRGPPLRRAHPKRKIQNSRRDHRGRAHPQGRRAGELGRRKGTEVDRDVLCRMLFVDDVDR